MRSNEEIIELDQRRSMLKGQLSVIDEKIKQANTKSTDGIYSPELANQKIRLEQEINELNRNIESLITTKEITQRVESELNVIRKSTTTASGIEPIFSVIRPNVKLVDASLAYKYADYQGDLNTFVGFTTLFLGTFIGSITSLGISAFTVPDKITIAIHSVMAFMSLLVSAIFGVLAWKGHKKSEEVKKLLETQAGENEVIIRRVARPAENPDEGISDRPLGQAQGGM